MKLFDRVKELRRKFPNSNLQELIEQAKEELAARATIYEVKMTSKGPNLNTIMAIHASIGFDLYNAEQFFEGEAFKTTSLKKALKIREVLEDKGAQIGIKSITPFKTTRM
jgi:hypothetical protein